MVGSTVQRPDHGGLRFGAARQFVRLSSIQHEIWSAESADREVECAPKLAIRIVSPLSKFRNLELGLMVTGLMAQERARL